ncbi:hypothetical protein B2J88_32665 [Rhodococcus sp. SRB_17]|uniref:helix-turn-helix domain-containing protein n=1 Tax=Acidovorax sp. SRB_24 TaxID=1962700 RepID=UPI00145E99B6|nr:helix-turn-helix domain-containing protein [Acidovorax sp. SRB_24]NMM78571.1 hypothetical protein [Acidovorax sp. SRB_24]NMM89045.1 hypothetical protein [Rhodococcus sp. SRB_17]
MSIRAMKRVWATEIQPAGRKLVALKLADHCNDTGGSLFVGMAAIARDCGISRSQAQRHVHALVDAGLLSVTANASGGARGVVPHYRLHVERLSNPFATGSTDATRSTGATRSTDATGSTHATREVELTDSADEAASIDATSHTDATGSTDAAGSANVTPDADMTSSASATGGARATGSTDATQGSHGCGDGVAPMRHTGSAHATQTTNNHQLTIIEPSEKTRARKASTVDVDLADLRTGVDEQVWRDWVALRAKKKAPITRTALTAIVAEAAKVRFSLNEALTLCCTRGWTGFDAAWVRRDDRTTTKSASKHSGFGTLDYREGINHDGSFV